MNVLVTGATGFLGKATALRLKSDGHSVSGLGRNVKAGGELERAGIRFVCADLGDRDAVVAACAGVDAVVHCAALASPWGKYEDFYHANVVGTRNVLEGCRRHGVKRIVNISTPSIYFDYHHRTDIKESDPLPPKMATHYAATKLLADREIDAARAQGLQTIHLRPRAIFGPGDTTVLGRLLPLVEKGAAPLIDGGHSLVDMTYIDNVVDAIVASLLAPSSATGQTFNITNGEPTSTKEILELLSREMGLPFKYRNLPFWAAYLSATVAETVWRIFRRSGEPPLTRYAVGLMSRSQTLNIDAARRELGYSPKVSLREGMRRFAASRGR